MKSELELSADDLLDFHDDVDEDEPEHVDERWLISYADMMTLLFGLFVMLYAMADHFEIIQHSAQQQFSPTQPAAKMPVAEVKSPATPNDTLEVLQTERAIMIVKIAGLEAALKAEQAKSAALSKISQSAEKVDVLMREQDTSARRMKVLERENSDLSRKLTEKNALQAADINLPVKVPEAATHTSGAAPIPGATYKLVIPIATGSPFEAKVMKISLSGVDLNRIPPGEVASTFKATLMRDDGDWIELTCFVVLAANGQRTAHLAITNISSEHEIKLRDWFKPR